MTDDVEIRPCRTHDELDQCVLLQKKVWGFDDLEIVPRRTLVATNTAGGVVLGAFDLRNQSLLGFAWLFPGRCQKTKNEVYFHLELIGVNRDVTGHRIGQRLLAAMRVFALSQDIELIMFNFDPMDSKLAHLYIRRLGAIGVQYKNNYYGQTSFPIQKHLPTDRLHVECWLSFSCMKQRSELIDELLSSDADGIHEIHLPASIGEWRRSGDPQAAIVQSEIRAKLTQAFEQNLAILDFDLKSDGSGIYKIGRYPSQEILIGEMKNTAYVKHNY